MALTAARSPLRPWLVGSPGLVALLGVASAVLLVVVFAGSERQLRRDVPINRTIDQLRLEVGLSHLWLEEHLSGDRTIVLDRDVVANLERARELTRSLLAEESVEPPAVEPFGPIEGPLDDPRLRRSAELLLEQLEELAALTHRRIAEPANGGVGSTMDADYDELFRRILERAAVLDREVGTGMMANHRRTRLLFSGIFVIWCVLVLVAVTNLNSREQRRREAVEALRRSEGRLSTTLKSLVDAVITTDRAGRVTFMNRVAEDLTGWPLAEAEGSPVAMVFRSGARPDGSRPEGPYVRALREGTVVVTADQLLEGRDGRSIPIDETAAPIFSDGPAPAGVVLVFRDVSERQRTTAALQESEAQLRHSQKLEAVGRLAGGLAHDINNYLASITVECDLLQILGAELPELDDRVGSIVDSVFKASSLLERLLAFSRKQPTRPEVIDLNRVIGGMESMLRRLIGEDIRFEIELEEGLWRVKADPTQVEQVLVNLMVNARDAMPQGGRLWLRSGNVSVSDQDPRRTGEYVALFVSDTGGGIPAEVRDKIFEPFFTTKDKSGSSGLGLSTIYGIVEECGGWIRVDSEVGSGTTFEVFLPRCEESARVEEVRVPPPAAVAAARSRNILLVEDNDDVRRSIGAYLEVLGHRVTAVAGPRQALEAHRDRGADFDLVISDILMPEMSGKELVEQLAEEGGHAPVLFVSADTDDVPIDELTAKAGIELLRKPFVPSLLAEKVVALTPHLDKPPVRR